MIVTRRRFLSLSVVIAGGAATALMTAQSVKAWLLVPFRALYHQLLSPSLEDAPTGTPSARALNALLGTTRALAGVPVQRAHYEDFFRWRAENLGGYKAIYEQFAEALDDRAWRSVGYDFVDCSRETQQEILDVFERNWLFFERYIVRDILALFYKTDAWTLLGYEAWPGTPRGLDRYTQPPPSQAR
jgi:hypothetical protein